MDRKNSSNEAIDSAATKAKDFVAKAGDRANEAASSIGVETDKVAHALAETPPVTTHEVKDAVVKRGNGVKEASENGLHEVAAVRNETHTIEHKRHGARGTPKR